MEENNELLFWQDLKRRKNVTEQDIKILLQLNQETLKINMKNLYHNCENIYEKDEIPLNIYRYKLCIRNMLSTLSKKNYKINSKQLTHQIINLRNNNSNKNQDKNVEAILNSLNKSISHVQQIALLNIGFSILDDLEDAYYYERQCDCFVTSEDFATLKQVVDKLNITNKDLSNRIQLLEKEANQTETMTKNDIWQTFNSNLQTCMICIYFAVLIFIIVICVIANGWVNIIYNFLKEHVIIECIALLFTSILSCRFVYSNFFTKNKAAN